MTPNATTTEGLEVYHTPYPVSAQVALAPVPCNSAQDKLNSAFS